MVAGLLLGQWIPGVNTALNKVQMTVFPADRPRPTDHDVPGARQGSLRPPRHGPREIARQMSENTNFTTPLMRLQDPNATKVLLVTSPKPHLSSKPLDCKRICNARGFVLGRGWSTTPSTPLNQPRRFYSSAQPENCRDRHHHKPIQSASGDRPDARRRACWHNRICGFV